MPRKRKSTSERLTRKPGEPKPTEESGVTGPPIIINKPNPRQWQFPRLKAKQLRKMRAEDRKRREKAEKALTALKKSEFTEELKRLDDNALQPAVELANDCLASGRASSWGKNETHYEKIPFLVDFIAHAKAPEYEGGRPSQFSVPSLLNLDLEGKWSHAKGKNEAKVKAIQAETRAQVLGALRSKAPEKFRHLAWMEGKGIYTGAQEVINLAETKHHLSDPQHHWPSISKGLQWIASGKPYPVFVGLKKGLPVWRDRRVSVDLRYKALEAMARHPEKKDFDVIGEVLRECLRKKNRDAADLVHACYETLYYNHEMMSAQQKKEIVGLLMHIKKLAQKISPKKFPVFSKTLLDLVMVIDQPVYNQAMAEAKQAKARADTVEIKDSQASTD